MRQGFTDSMHHCRRVLRQQLLRSTMDRKQLMGLHLLVSYKVRKGEGKAPFDPNPTVLVASFSPAQDV